MVFSKECKVRSEVKLGVIGVIVALVVIGGLMFGVPWYRVWNAGMSGKAALMQAEQEKQIAVETAKAEVEAAKLRAEAIALVGKASQQYPEYRQQEFIGAFGEAIKSGQVEQIIYVPTEANIPIVEAGRMAAERR
jgi:hypothetical protein